MSARRIRTPVRAWIGLHRPRSRCRRVQRDTCREESSRVSLARAFPAAPAVRRYGGGAWKWIGSGGPRGLQIRWDVSDASGGFDSHPLPPCFSLRFRTAPPVRSTSAFHSVSGNSSSTHSGAPLPQDRTCFAPPATKRRRRRSLRTGCSTAGRVCPLRVDSRRARQGSTHAIRICESPRASGAS